MNVASSGSVDGTRVAVDGEDASGDDVVAVVEEAVSGSFNSAAKRTMSLAFTINVSRSWRASFMWVSWL